MKKNLILIAVLFTVLNGIAQNRAVVSKEHRNKSLKNSPAISETENLQGEWKEAATIKDVEASYIGNTYFDLQSNSSSQNRIFLYDDGKIGATFTYGMNYAAFLDRGTGYNFFNGISWNPYPLQRIENDRTGWPSYSPWGINGEINVAHYSSTSTGGLAIYGRTTKGSGAWSSNILHGPLTNAELLWPRSTTAGIDNSVLHVIALTMPLANGGVIYLGQDGALVYSRSANGGQTWDIQNVIIPGMGSAFYTGFQGDTYEIVAKDNNIAILIGDDWMDLVLLESNNSGNTWTKTVIWDHPYPLWDPNNQFPTDTFYCVDGTHSIAYDASGKIHIAFGISRAFSDGTTQYWFPLVDGVGYWNEDMATFSNDLNALSPYGDLGSELIEDYNLIGWMQDINNNGTLDILGEPGIYYSGTSSMPQLVIDEQNNVFLVYSSVTETYNNGIQDYRHLWARGSNDNGLTWGDFVDLNNGLIYTFNECVFPSCSPTSDGNIYLVYQQDYDPGMAVRGDLDPYAENIIEYMKIPKADLIYVPNLGTLTGTVTELNGGAPISGATVAIEGTSYFTNSNYIGNYSISNIPIGTYTVNCSKTGFYDQSYAIVIYENQISTLNFQLTEIVIPGDQVIGHTWYDNQSNGSMQNRIHMYPDGYIGTTFMYGISEPTFSERGTGYNRFDGTSWGPIPNQRIEPDRAGWPSYTPCGPDGEMVVAHYSGGSQTGPLAISKRTNKGTGSWVTTAFSPPSGASGLLWSRAISGGDNFNSIHMIALTTPVSNGGYIYEGQDGALLYSRSLNGGQTWDLQNTILSDIDVNYYNGFTADIYEFAAPRDNTVAILIGDAWRDLILLKSNDNGSTWEKTIVWEHPYPFWNGQPTDLFFCPDGAHSIAIDNSGKIHIAFGITKTYSDEVGSTYLYPLVGGIGYWNEDMPVFSSNLNALSPYGDPGSELIPDYNFIGWEQDINNNGTWDILGDVGTYYLGSSSMPQLIIDETNNIFLVFSSVTETFNNGTQDYRHIWARGSDDNGQTWGNFIDITADFTSSECVFPSCSPSSNEYLHMIFQEDNEPGMAIRGDMDPYGENDIEYKKIEKSILISTIPDGILEGVVTSLATGNPIQGAVILLVGTSYTTSTTVSGHYSISNIQPGVYTVECSKEGFLTATATVNIIQNNTIFQNFQLEVASINPPQNLIGTVINNDVLLQWDPPGNGISQWIQWDAGINNGNAVGLAAGGTFFVASHWEQNDLLPYDGMELSRIAFYPNGDPTASFNLYVWTGPDAANQVVSQPVGNYIVDEWNEVTLSSPVLIDASQELWFGYSVTHIPGMWPAGCDDGPAIQGTGDMISTGGTWSSLYVLTNGNIDANWNLAGYVETTDKKEPAKPMVKTVIEPALSSFVSANEFGKTGNIQKKFIPFENKALLGFNVYKNSMIIGFTTNTYYLDENIGLGTFEYYVTALYDEGVSVPSNSVWIVLPEPCGPPVNIVATVVNQNEIEISWEPPLIGTPLGYNLYRDNTLIDYITALLYIEPNVGPGTYNYCVSAVCLDGESEMACADPVTINYLAPPINLIAMINGNFINLAWDPPPNATELLGYNVYHKYENGTFNLLDFTQFTYYIMPEVPTGLHSFCVAAIYFEGGSDCSDIVEVLITSVGENNIGGLDVYPNPATEEIYVSSDSTIKSISIYNSFGQLMKNHNVSDKNFRFNVSKFNPGVYVLKIEFSDGLISKRIVIE